MTTQVNEWMPVATAKPDGTQCELRFRDPLGQYDDCGPFFLHDDGKWYRIEPPKLIKATPTHYKPI